MTVKQFQKFLRNTPSLSELSNIEFQIIDLPDSQRLVTMPGKQNQ